MPQQNTQPTAPQQQAPAGQNFNLKDAFNKFELWLNDLLVTKAPAMPVGAKNAIVQYGPWIAAVFLVLGLFALIGLFFIGTFVAGLSVAVGYTPGFVQIFFGFIFLVPIMVLEAIAIPGLIARSKSKGWNLVFYANLVQVVYYLFTLNFLSLLLSIVWFYVLFQIREYYK